MSFLPGTPALRRRAAIGFLALGTLLAAKALVRAWPREQTLIFRLDDQLRHTPLRLSASLVRAGESEPLGGMSVERSGSESGDPRQTLRLPDGDYVLTVDWERREGSTAEADGSAVAAVEKGETSSVRRVTLHGGEIVVPVATRVPE